MQRRSPIILLMLALAAAFALLGYSGRPVAAQGSNWTAQYWNNKSMSGKPVLVETVPAIDFYWGYSSPDPNVVNTDNWSARFTQTLYGTAGNYRIVARMDDGMRVYVDDQLIIDSWYDSQEHAVTRDFYLSKTGYHTIRADYYDSTGVAMAVLDWTPLGNGGGGQFFPNWKGEYFTNRNLVGAPVLVRDEPQIDFNWGGGSPAPGIIPNDEFSARYTKTIQMPAGQYRITMNADNGARLYLNDRMVIDNWQFTGSPVAVDYFHDGQPVNARVEYYEGTQSAKLQLGVALVTTDPGVIGGGGSSSGQCPTPGTWQAVFTANSVVRTGPGKEYDVVTSVDRCTILTLTGYKSPDNRWVGVRKDGAGGYEGWADVALLALGTSTDQLNPWTGGTSGGGSSGGGGSNSGGDFGGVYLPPANVDGSPVYCPAAPVGLQGLAKNNVNIRSGAGRDYPILTTVPQCAVVTLTGYKTTAADGSTWVSVSVPGSNKFDGWVDAQYLMLATPLQELITLPAGGGGAVG